MTLLAMSLIIGILVDDSIVCFREYSAVFKIRDIIKRMPLSKKS